MKIPTTIRMTPSIQKRIIEQSTSFSIVLVASMESDGAGSRGVEAVAVSGSGGKYVKTGSAVRMGDASVGPVGAGPDV